MNRYFKAFLIGSLVTLLFTLLAGVGGGACHCTAPMGILFPYVSLLGMNADWGIVGNALFWIQCPLYAVCVAAPGSGKWRAGVLLILLAAHGCAVAVAFQLSG